MESITLGQWQGFAVVSLALLGLIAALGKAAEVIRTWRTPARRQEQRITECESRLSRDYARLTSLEEGNRVQCRALLALLNHEITGNSVDKLKDAQTGINDYLVNK